MTHWQRMVQGVAGAWLVAGLSLSGCAHHQQPRPGARSDWQQKRIDMEPMLLEAVPGTDGPRVEAVDAASLFEQAGKDLDAGSYAEAAAGYDRIGCEFPQSRYAVPALYNAGLSFQGLRRFDEAAARFRRLVDEHPLGKEALDAQFRLGECYAELQQWGASLAVYEQVLRRPELSLSDRIEAMSRRGLAQVELGDLATAEHSFRDLLDYFKENQDKERLDSDFYLGMARFYLGQIPHRMFRALPLRLPQRQLEQDLESKARMFLQAQARYIDAVRQQDPVWATAAGYQIGALYKEMYDTLVGAPVPPELDTAEKRQVYADVLKDRLRVLLEKARRIHEKNLLMAERIGAKSDWVQRSTEQLAEIDRMLASVGGGQAAPAPVPVPGDDKGPVAPPPGPKTPASQPRLVL